MADTLIRQTYALWFQRIANYGITAATDDELTDWLEALVEVDISGKADKVESAVAGHFASLDADGNLVDSGLNDLDFIRAGTFFDDRYYTKDEITAFLAEKLGVVIADGRNLNIVTAETDGSAVFDSGVALASLVTAAMLAGYYTSSQVDALLEDKISIPNVSVPDGEILAWDGTVFGNTGVNLSDLALASALGSYYTITQIDGFLADKINMPGDIAVIDGEILAWDSENSVFNLTGVSLSGLALASALSGKADKVSGAILNNFASLDDDGNLLDSGYAIGNLLLLSNLTNYSLNPAFGSLQLGSSGFYALSANNSTGAGTTPNGTLRIYDNNGHSYYILTSAAA